MPRSSAAMPAPALPLKASVCCASRQGPAQPAGRGTPWRRRCWCSSSCCAGLQRLPPPYAYAAMAADVAAVEVVVGLPLNMDGSEGRAAEGARSEAARLATVVNVPVVLHDERLTTVEADRALLEARMKAQARRRVVDKVAAAVMLQSWLDSGRGRRSDVRPG